MTYKTVVSRRAFCLGLSALPSLGSAAPLIDIGGGSGLFSQTIVQGYANSKRGMLGLFGGDGPDPAPGTLWTPKKSPVFRAVQPITLALRNSNTNEAMTLAIQPGTTLRSRQINQLNRFLRDWRKNEIKPIDGVVLNSLLEICSAFASGSKPLNVQITSGYRSKATNDMLRRKSRNVARNSLHTQARAIDFSLPDVPVAKLGRLAQQVCSGGVGRYRTFVHIDSGPRRHWSA